MYDRKLNAYSKKGPSDLLGHVYEHFFPFFASVASSLHKRNWLNPSEWRRLSGRRRRSFEGHTAFLSVGLEDLFIYQITVNDQAESRLNDYFLLCHCQKFLKTCSTK